MLLLRVDWDQIGGRKRSVPIIMQLENLHPATSATRGIFSVLCGQRPLFSWTKETGDRVRNVRSPQVNASSGGIN